MSASAEEGEGESDGAVDDLDAAGGATVPVTDGEEEEEEEEGDDDDDDDDDDETVQPLCLFIPAGWWHWLAGDSAWHVAWSGSFFPGTERPKGGAGTPSCGKGTQRGGGAEQSHGRQKNDRGKRGKGGR